MPYLRAQKAGIEYEDALQKLSKATGYQPDAIRRIAESAPQEEEDYSKLVSLREMPRKQAITRLQAAEKRLLYYMLKDPMAVKAYQEIVGSFFDDTYRLAANYIIDYSRAHPGEVIDVSLLCAESNMDGNEDVSSAVADIALEKSHEPASEELLSRVARTVAEEKRKQMSELEVETSLQEGDDETSLKRLQEFIAQRARQLKK